MLASLGAWCEPIAAGGVEAMRADFRRRPFFFQVFLFVGTISHVFQRVYGFNSGEVRLFGSVERRTKSCG
jgi:hypothetical protein